MRSTNLHKIQFDGSLLISSEQCISELNSRYAFTVIGGKARVIDTWDSDLKLVTKEAFFAMFANRLVDDNGKYISAGEYWWHHPDRRQYLDGVTFDPSAGSSNSRYNLWRGPSVIASAASSCERLLWHLEHVICGSNQNCFEYLVNWLSLMMQKPGVLPGTAICMLSAPGTGKGIAMQYIGRMLGPNYIPVTHIKDLTGRFTACLERAVLIFADEVSWTSNKASRSLLKTLITEPDRVIEKKGVDAFKVRNCAHLVFASNDSNAIPAEIGDRRYFVLEVSDRKIGDTQYFSELACEMNSGGPEALLHYLQQRDISSFDPTKFPGTSSRVRQILHTLSPVAQWYFEVLVDTYDSEVINNEVPKEHTHSVFMRWHNKQYGTPGANIAALTQELKQFGVTQTRPRSNGGRTRCYTFPTGEAARRNFESVIGGSIDWHLY